MYSSRIDKKILNKIEKKYNTECYADVTGYLFKQSHNMMEKFLNKKNYDDILEVGAGMQPHLNFINHEFKNYFCLENSKIAIKFLKKKFNNIKTIFSNSSKIPNKKFDRIILSHSLEHIHKPEVLLKSLFKKLKKDGVMSIAIPIDPGILYRFARSFKRSSNNLDLSSAEYDYVNALEHINSYQNNDAIIKYLFKNYKKFYYPLNFLPYDLNLFCFYQIFKNKY